MRIREKEIQRLKTVNSLVKANFPMFGVNKTQEITRLLYEISKRENIPPGLVLQGISFAAKPFGLGRPSSPQAAEGCVPSFCRKAEQSQHDYNAVKKYLLARRYPYAFACSESARPYLPRIELKLSGRFNPEKSGFYPKNIFVEKKASEDSLALRFKAAFPKARFNQIESLKNYLCAHRGFGIKDYNNRRDTVFIVKQKYDFFKRCPCTKGALACGYHIFNLGFGCVFDCSYCFLQGYANSPGIILPSNIDSFFDKFSYYAKMGMRIGTGEFSDSLALDDITRYSVPLIEFFRRQKGITFEFKTKSVNIKNILTARHSGNIVVSWSVNPQSIIDKNEFFTPSLKQRLDAALKCTEAGYRVGFHFDPVIYFEGWEKEYALLIENLFAKVNPKHMAWISIGTFRFRPGLKQAIEERFPENTILNEELLLGFDNKLRYPYRLRLAIYKKMVELISKHFSKPNLYLCMEDISIIRGSGLYA